MSDKDDLELRACLEPVWFRVEARHYSTHDGDGDAIAHYSDLKLIRIPVQKHTPKGAWLRGPFNPIKLVLREYTHRARAYAAPTQEQAKEDFRKRKQYRIMKLQAQINRAEQEIAMLDRGRFQLS